MMQLKEVPLIKMAKTKSKIIRASERFDEFLIRAANQRVKNNVDKRGRHHPELTDMMLNCPSFMKVAEELTRLPKKEDIRK